MTAAAAAIGGGATAVAAPPSQVLHYFMKSETWTFVNAGGKAFTPSRTDLPKPGDIEERTDLDYPGTSSRHAADWTATDHQLCQVDRQVNLACRSEISIGGSMILAQVTLSNPSTVVREKIDGGTGIYRGVSGTIVAVDPSTSSHDGNLTITLHRP